MTSRIRVVGILSVVALASLPPAAQATPVTYDEAIFGDLPSSPDFPKIFIFDLGSNTIKGTMQFIGGIPDFDEFLFVLPERRITAITFAFETQTLGPGVMTATTEYRLQVPGFGAPILEEDTIDLLGGSPVHPFESAIGFQDGALLVAQPLLEAAAIGGIPADFTTNYTWTFEVAGSLPEPSTICLFGTGLAATYFSRRRGRTHRHSPCRNHDSDSRSTSASK